MNRPWPAPAKLNLFLHVIGRRPDGYHELQTVFQLIDLCDFLTFRPTDDGTISRPAGAPGFAWEDDLAVRAARLLQAETGCSRGVEIRIDKRIPPGGGLGGGSSDAATALVALNHVWGTGLPRETLAALGLRLGADVPVFVGGRSGWAEGVGERLTPLDLPGRWYAVVRPDCEVGTAGVFRAPELTRNTPPTTITGFLSSGGRNDCEPVVRRRHPEVAEALDWLAHRAQARLTGTGSCVFAPAADEAAARRMLEGLPGRWQGFVARGLNESPLLAREREAAGAQDPGPGG